MNLRRCPHGSAPAHIRHGLLRRLQSPVSLPQRSDLAVLVLNSALDAVAFRAADCLRHLVFVRLLGLLEAVSVELATILSQSAERLHRDSCLGLQGLFAMVSLGAAVEAGLGG